MAFVEPHNCLDCFLENDSLVATYWFSWNRLFARVGRIPAPPVGALELVLLSSV